MIILASKSPRRKQLLEWAEVPFKIITQDTDEDYPATLPVHDIPVYIAKKKAKAVQEKINNNKATILAADTIVVINNKVIGKPINRAEAIATLKLLSGQVHEVITGVVILKEEKEVFFSEITQVEFHPLTKEQIIFYIDKYQPYDKAGAYAIQEWIGVVGIKNIKGDFYNVMGLPVSRVVPLL
ncbi:MAG: Maf family nucleotide pyrophosphatase [Chitinophagaceae bacterium]|jgi:septum formation protein|nr:Maf family nucleotide pyrophosphatase [Chitinophagaceae bacterium]